MVLRAALRDLDRTDQRCEPAGQRPVHAGDDAVQQPGAIRIAATGRIDDGLRRNARNVEPLAVGEDRASRRRRA